jgi:hypothetical protein
MHGVGYGHWASSALAVIGGAMPCGDVEQEMVHVYMHGWIKGEETFPQHGARRTKVKVATKSHNTGFVAALLAYLARTSMDTFVPLVTYAFIPQMMEVETTFDMVDACDVGANNLTTLIERS